LRDLTAWVLTDGKAGDEQQCLGVTQALGLEAEIRRVRPRAPFAWAMPWGPVDPRERPGRGPLEGSLPDLVVASGRRAVPYLRAVRRASGGRTYTVFLKDPRTGTGAADLIWVPAHDRLRGDNVVVTLTPPHRVSADRLEAARRAPDPRLIALPSPRAAVLVGGSSRHHSFTEGDAARFGESLEALARSGVALMGTLSRRSDPALRARVERCFREAGGFLWDGTGENPYLALLALADAVVVTADSYNMAGEAAATGAPVLVFEPSGGHPKLDAFLDGLRAKGIVHPFRGRLEGERYEPLNSTLQIAEAVRRGLARHRARLAAG
jgi:mitochondrial fission protein ELM1